MLDTNKWMVRLLFTVRGAIDYLKTLTTIIEPSTKKGKGVGRTFTLRVSRSSLAQNYSHFDMGRDYIAETYINDNPTNVWKKDYNLRKQS